MATTSSLAAYEGYSRVAIWLHWIIAILLIANLALGLFFDEFDKPLRSSLMAFHKATGLTVLALTLARIAWRLTHRPPEFDSALKPWEARLAGLTHALFYVALIAIPLSGWLLVSNGGRVTSVYGLFEVPALPVSRGDDLHDTLEEAHALIAYATIGLIALHVAGALKHHFSGHRHLIGRMSLRRERRS